MKRESGRFLMARRNESGKVEYVWRRYISTFVWQGEVFVISAAGRRWYRVSHKASGLGCGSADSQVSAEQIARMALNAHPRVSMRQIRKATAKRGAPSVSRGLALATRADHLSASDRPPRVWA